MESAAEYIKNHKSGIISVWEDEVNKKIHASKNTDSLLLRNLLPDILDDVANILEQKLQYEDIDEEKCGKLKDKSIDHGKHRATSAYYTVRQVIKEYMVLARVIIRELKSKNLYNERVGLSITKILEISMAHAVGSFTDSIQEMKEKLVGMLAHDIRNPVFSAALALDILDRNSGEEEFNKIKSMGKSNLKRSLDLLEGMLDAITISAGEGISLNYSELDILEEVRKVWEEAEEIYVNKIVFECEEEEIIGIFDGTAVRRVLENFLTNALKYAAPGSPITISLEDRVEEVILSVHNTGNPINPEDQEKIFEFLSHSETNSEGGLRSWGIGLAFVKMAAEAHNGYVTLDSSREKGTTFSVVLKKFSQQPGKTKIRLNYSKK